MQESLATTKPQHLVAQIPVLKPAAGAAGCKQHVPRSIAVLAMNVTLAVVPR